MATVCYLLCAFRLQLTGYIKDTLCLVWWCQFALLLLKSEDVAILFCLGSSLRVYLSPDLSYRAWNAEALMANQHGLGQQFPGPLVLRKLKMLYKLK